MCYRPNDSDIGMWVGKYVKDRRTEGWDGGRAAGRIVGWLPTLRRRNGPALSNVFITLYIYCSSFEYL
jgi:hypothetical protein